VNYEDIALKEKAEGSIESRLEKVINIKIREGVGFLN